MAIKITAPIPVDGVQMYGPHSILFVAGVAEVDELAVGVEMYLREHGYGLEYLELPDDGAPEPEPMTEQVGEATEEPRVEVTPEPNTEPVLVGETGPELIELPKGARVIHAPRKPKAE